MVRHLSHAAWTIVIHCFTVFLTVCTTFAVSPKCCSTSCHWHAVVWSYHPSSPSVALVTSPPANSFQDCWLCFPGIDQPSTRHLADDCRLISDSEQRKVRSSDIRTFVTPKRLRDWDSAIFNCWFSILERSTICAPDLTIDRFKWELYIGVVRSQRLVAIDYWRCINLLFVYVCMYVNMITYDLMD